MGSLSSASGPSSISKKKSLTMVSPMHQKILQMEIMKQQHEKNSIQEQNYAMLKVEGSKPQQNEGSKPKLNNLTNAMKNQRNQTENSAESLLKQQVHAKLPLPNIDSIKGFEPHLVDIVTQIDAFPGELIISNDKNRSQDISTVRDKDAMSPGGTMRDQLNTFLKQASPNEDMIVAKSPTNVTIEKLSPTEISTHAFKSNMMEVQNKQPIAQVQQNKVSSMIGKIIDLQQRKNLHIPNHRIGSKTPTISKIQLQALHEQQMIKRILNDSSPKGTNKLILPNSIVRQQIQNATHQSFALDSLIRESIDIPPTANIQPTLANNSKMKVEDYENIAALKDTEKTNSVNEVSGRTTTLKKPDQENLLSLTNPAEFNKTIGSNLGNLSPDQQGRIIKPQTAGNTKRQPWSNLNAKNVMMQKNPNLMNIHSNMSGTTQIQSNQQEVFRNYSVNNVGQRRQIKTQQGTRQNNHSRIGNNKSVISQRNPIDEQSQINALKNSFAILEEFSVRDIKSRIYNRDGVISADDTPFFMKQQNKERMIRTNRSHNLRAKDTLKAESRFATNCRPIKQNYIFSRMKINQRHFEKCVDKQMTVFEKEMKDQMRLKNMMQQVLVIQEPKQRAVSQQHEARPVVIIPQNNFDEDNYMVISPMLNQQMFPQPASAVIQESHSAIPDQVYSQKGTEESPVASPATPHKMVSKSKQKIRNLQNFMTESMKHQEKNSYRGQSCRSNLENKSKISSSKARRSNGSNEYQNFDFNQLAEISKILNQNTNRSIKYEPIQSKIQRLSSQVRINQKNKQPVVITQGHHDLEQKKMLKVLQNNFETKDQGKPMWSVGQKLNGTVINYKTEDGHNLVKSPAIKSPKNTKLPDHPGDRATYGMKDLKVRANKRFMAMSVITSSRDVSNIENLNLESNKFNHRTGQSFWIDKSKLNKSLMQGLNDQDSIINSLQMCVPTATAAVDEKEFINKIRQSYNSSDPQKLDPKNLNIADIIKSIKNENGGNEQFETMKIQTDQHGPSQRGESEKKYLYVQNQGSIMIPVIQKHPMGNMAITNSFKPKETLRENNREFSFVSQAEIHQNELTKEEHTPNANQCSKEIEMLGQIEQQMDENLIYVRDESKRAERQLDVTLEGADLASKLVTMKVETTDCKDVQISDQPLSPVSVISDKTNHLSVGVTSGDEMDTKNSHSKIVYQTKKGQQQSIVQDEQDPYQSKDAKMDYENPDSKSLAYGLDALGKCSTHRIVPGERSITNPKVTSEQQVQQVDQMAMVRSISFKQILVSSQQHTQHSNENKPTVDEKSPIAKNRFNLSNEIQNVTNGFVISSMELNKLPLKQMKDQAIQPESADQPSSPGTVYHSHQKSHMGIRHSIYEEPPKIGKFEINPQMNFTSVIDDPIRIQGNEENQKIKDIVKEITKQPIHANPPKYLQKNDIGQKFKFVQKHRRGRSQNKTAIMASQMETSSDAFSFRSVMDQKKAYLLPLGIVQGDIQSITSSVRNSSEKQGSVFASKITNKKEPAVAIKTVKTLIQERAANKSGSSNANKKIVVLMNQDEPILAEKFQQNKESDMGKITLDSAAVHELLNNHEYLDSYLSGEQSIRMRKLDQTIEGRPLFVLPTSDVADLFKEQKEMEIIQNFGIIGKQSIITNK